MQYAFKPLALALLLAGTAHADVVISQIYGGGGNSGAPYRNDFVELFNAGTSAVVLDGWSVQYASASGTSWQTTPLTGMLAPGQYFLVQEAAGANATATPLPAADATGNIAMSSSQGKVALVRSANALACGSSCAGLADVADLIGFGSANDGFGAPAPALSNTLAAQRLDQGCRNTRNASADFTTAPPGPRSSVSTLHPCSDVAPTPTPVPTPPPTAGNTRIHDIQGRTHRSPYTGQSVSLVPGVVTVVLSSGFYFEDEQPDNDAMTSEGLYVYTGKKPTVAVGDRVLVSGKVSEFRPGGSGGAANLTITEIASNPQVAILAHGQPLPAPVNLGGLLPDTRIWSGSVADVEQAGALDPANGLDVLESLEGMRVQLDHAVAVGPTNSYDEVAMLPDFGNRATLRTPRGGIVIREDDFNPERVIVDEGSIKPPQLDTGDGLERVVGVVDYSFGNYKLLASEIGQITRAGLQPETTQRQNADELAVASFNVENLSAQDDAGKFERLATQIVQHLQAPDVIGVMEVQDNNGATNDAVVSADQTLARLTAAISAAGGPSYAYRQIDPVDDQDGGQPGGNIRVVFLYNPARVSFVDRAGGAPTSSTAVTRCGTHACLTQSPGRIAPLDPAFANSRKPLAGEFVFHGRRVLIVANHFNSKGGDAPLYGHAQPPARSSEVQRGEQAQRVADFVQQALSIDANARVIVLGDLNDFQFSPALATLKSAGLTDLVETLPENERYTYVYDGNSQALDHILASPALARVAAYDVVHVNAEFASQTSDHDPEVARFALGTALPACYGVWRADVAYAGGMRSSLGLMNYEARWWSLGETPASPLPDSSWQLMGTCSDELDVPAQPVLTPSADVQDWTAGASYQRGDRVRYRSATWLTRVAHTAQAGWTPEQAVSLWQKLP
ncbi:endonuclease/exonuclease/phosphatase family protein [Chitinibacteraceae bacterium HSL-7]